MTDLWSVVTRTSWLTITQVDYPSLCIPFVCTTPAGYVPIVSFEPWYIHLKRLIVYGANQRLEQTVISFFNFCYTTFSIPVEFEFHRDELM